LSVSRDWPQRAAPEICTGRVMHKRLRPATHQFSYAVFFMRIPLTALSSTTPLENRWFSFNRFNLLSFHSRDHGPRDGSSLEAWIRDLLAREGVHGCDGQIVLQAFPRVLGYVFNPITIWYCHDRDGGLRAAMAEVRNTFGEYHNYLVAHGDGRVITADDWLHARKIFHVSPFCDVKGHYRFRFEQNGVRAFAQIDYFDGADDESANNESTNDESTNDESTNDENANNENANNENANNASKLIITTVHGAPAALTSASAAKAFLNHPLMTIGVVARIHWQALKLWLKRVPYFAKPAPPTLPTSR
jgi:uncharacterized protein